MVALTSPVYPFAQRLADLRQCPVVRRAARRARSGDRGKWVQFDLQCGAYSYSLTDSLYPASLQVGERETLFSAGR